LVKNDKNVEKKPNFALIIFDNIKTTFIIKQNYNYNQGNQKGIGIVLCGVVA